MSPRSLPLLAAVVSILAWASAFVVIRAVGVDFRPGPLALGRLAIGVTGLGALLVRAGWMPPTRREWALLVGCGASWFALYNVVLAAAERRLDAGTTAMVVNVGPIFLALLAAGFLGERLTRWLLAGAGVSMIGIALIASGRTGTDHAAVDPAGVALCVVAAAAYAVGVVLQKQALRRLPALQVTWTACAAGGLACLAFAGDLRADIADAPLESILGVLYLGAVPTAVAFTTWAYALARTEASRLGAMTYAVPPLAVLLSWLTLGETPSPHQLAGGVLCLIGVVVARARPAAQRRSAGSSKGAGAPSPPPGSSR